jgi:hypothetical protein
MGVDTMNQVGQRSSGFALRVEVTHAATLNFAMEQSGVPVISGVRIENCGRESLENGTLWIDVEPQIAPPASHPIPKVRPGESVDLGVVDVRLEPGRLRGPCVKQSAHS